MLRYLSAIGMSRCTGTKAITAWTKTYLDKRTDRPTTFKWPGSDQIQLEFRHEMGPFRLIMKAAPEAGGVMHVYSALPGVRPGSFSRLAGWELGMEDTHLVVFGEDEVNGNPLVVRMEETGKMMNLPIPKGGEGGTLHYAGLSIEGKVILGMMRTEEDERAYEEEDQWRQEMLGKLRAGDQEAMKAMEEEMAYQDQEIEARMQHEDIFTVLEGFFMPVEDLFSGVYSTLGTILDADKVLNPETEEWVWHLQLDVMSSALDVYIHPDDLVGMPLVGCRFLGKVLLVGSLRI